jgi:hypothetical protein
MLIFDANDLVKLLTHYTDGQVPFDAELREFKVSALLERVVGMDCTSSQWVDGTPTPDGGLSPLHIRYDGKRILTIGNKGEQPGWYDAPDSPTKRIV